MNLTSAIGTALLTSEDVDSIAPAAPGLTPVWIAEEVFGHLRAQSRTATGTHIRLYRVDSRGLATVAQVDLETTGRRADVVMSLLNAAHATGGVVVCSFRTAAAADLLVQLDGTRLEYVVEIPPERKLHFLRSRNGSRDVSPEERLKHSSWQRVRVSDAAQGTDCFAANLGKTSLGDVDDLTCFALSIGGIKDYRRGLMVGVTSLGLEEGLSNLAQLLAWTRWIRVAVRRAIRGSQDAARADGNRVGTFEIRMRSNRRIAASHDVRDAKQRAQAPDQPPRLRGCLTAEQRTLNVVELFAGAGGMGLGFLTARGKSNRRYRISASAEIDAIYTQTLRQNHAFMKKARLVAADSTPEHCKPLDLCSTTARRRLSDIARESGPVDVLIGGPPCQGFSSANRNSWSSSNPNNRLVDAFLDCVNDLSPKVLLMENVQGILWTRRDDEGRELSVAGHVLERLGTMGYVVFPKLLDAVWYGAPQNRNRFFLLGIHTDLGYSPDDFGGWGPFPHPTHGPGTGAPFVTVRDAIEDLPKLGNGEGKDEMQYEWPRERAERNPFLRMMRAGAPHDVIWDHITSKHADYVIERYKGIPQGGNWQDVRELMTNYADVERTHSNIYKRLAWSEPAITIGHYRKSMIIHPSQHRGLSLREATRLQTFPDWFRFAGTANGDSGGLMHQQQQLANAVCPAVTNAVAGFILTL